MSEPTIDTKLKAAGQAASRAAAEYRRVCQAAEVRALKVEKKEREAKAAKELQVAKVTGAKLSLERTARAMTLAEGQLRERQIQQGQHVAVPDAYYTLVELARQELYRSAKALAAVETA